MGVATFVVKIRTVRSVKRKKSANCLRIPAKSIFTLACFRRCVVLVRYQDLLSVVVVTNRL